MKIKSLEIENNKILKNIKRKTIRNIIKNIMKSYIDNIT